MISLKSGVHFETQSVAEHKNHKGKRISAFLEELELACMT